MQPIRAAAQFAAASHHGQRRKYSDEPYIRHPGRVAARVAQLGVDPEVVAAAWLHDVVEDCDVSVAEVAQRFGLRVARLVDYLSEPPSVPGGPNRAARKAAYRRRLASLRGRDGAAAHTVKAADCLDNIPSIRDADPQFWKLYRRELMLLADVLTMAHPDLLGRVAASAARRGDSQLRVGGGDGGPSVAAGLFGH
ncbi:MAG: HD domain-containing protein, partial [Pseudomonadales bacterium]